MKILLVAVNAKYIHSNLAVYSLPEKLDVSVASVTSGLVQDDMLKTIKAADNAMKRLRFIICLLVMSIV